MRNSGKLDPLVLIVIAYRQVACLNQKAKMRLKAHLYIKTPNLEEIYQWHY